MKGLRWVLAVGLSGGRLWAADPGWVADLDRAAEYQLRHPSHERPESSDPKGWVMGAFYAGLSAWNRTGAAGHHFRSDLLAVGKGNNWQLGPRLYHADDLCIGQTYEDLFEIYHEPVMIAAIRQRLDFILAHPSEGSLEFRTDASSTGWNWCDSLFMAPAAWTHLSVLTGNPAYRQYAVAHWWKTSDFLYDPVEHLFFRDSRYLPRHRPGPKVFWGRGNGWVIAGLARVLETLPGDEPARPRLERQFQEMASAVRANQLPDGGWTPDLLNGRNEGQQSEESGSGFFCFAFAWGINRGLLSAADYRGPAERAFGFLRGCEEPSGRVIHVQPIGYAPVGYPPDSSAPFGVGAYLLAGSEMRGLDERHRLDAR